MTAQTIDWTTAMTTKRQSAPGAAKSCEPFSADLSAYFDGELDAEERAAMELHLSSCAACRQKLDQMHTLRSAMTRLAAATPRGGSVLDLLKAEFRNSAAEKTGGRRGTS